MERSCQNWVVDDVDHLPETTCKYKQAERSSKNERNEDAQSKNKAHLLLTELQ